jgi:hypothetical protein
MLTAPENIKTQVLLTLPLTLKTLLEQQALRLNMNLSAYIRVSMTEISDALELLDIIPLPITLELKSESLAREANKAAKAAEVSAAKKALTLELRKAKKARKEEARRTAQEAKLTLAAGWQDTLDTWLDHYASLKPLSTIDISLQSGIAPSQAAASVSQTRRYVSEYLTEQGYKSVQIPREGKQHSVWVKSNKGGAA